jgi:5-methylcytosine-specific restriction endonuclease McrA
MSNPRRRNGSRRNLLRQRVLACYDYCALCKKPVDKTLHYLDDFAPEVDEILPVSRGGDPLDFNNCQLVHRVCNRIKGNRTNHVVDYTSKHLVVEKTWGVGVPRIEPEATTSIGLISPQDGRKHAA